MKRPFVAALYPLGLSCLALYSIDLRAEEVPSHSATASRPATSTTLPLPPDADLKRMAEEVVNESFSAVPPSSSSNRYQLNERLQIRDWDKGGAPTSSRTCHYDGSDVIVIAFEGTGAFEPRMAPAVQRLTDKLRSSNFDTRDPRFQPSALISDALGRKEGRSIRWSGLAHGSLSRISRNPKLSERVQWMSFPSEETELLADAEAYKNLNPAQVVTEFQLSSNATPENVLRADNCLHEMLVEAYAQKKSPKVVVLSHSSGGRAAVKFAEYIKRLYDPRTGKPDIQIDLMYTIDPVREAHEAVLLASREVVNKGTEHNVNKVRDFVGLPPQHVYPPNIPSQSQPAALYRSSNVLRHINFYQSLDEEGLKVGPRFGIHGSPMAGAQQNTHLGAADGGLGTAAHGEITYHPKVLDQLEKELEALVP